MTCLLHVPRLKLPDFHQVTMTHTGNTKSLLDTTNCCSLAHACMSDLLPKALMHHNGKCELTAKTLDATCLHVDMCCHWHLFHTHFCLLGDMLSVFRWPDVCVCVSVATSAQSTPQNHARSSRPLVATLIHNNGASSPGHKVVYLQLLGKLLGIIQVPKLCMLQKLLVPPWCC